MNFERSFGTFAVMMIMMKTHHLAIHIKQSTSSIHRMHYIPVTILREKNFNIFVNMNLFVVVNIWLATLLVTVTGQTSCADKTRNCQALVNGSLVTYPSYSNLRTVSKN
jgi:hypothetical protein